MLPQPPAQDNQADDLNVLLSSDLEEQQRRSPSTSPHYYHGNNDRGMVMMTNLQPSLGMDDDDNDPNTTTLLDELMVASKVAGGGEPRTASQKGNLIWEAGSYELYDYFMMHIGDLLQHHRLAAAYFRARYLFLSLIPSAGLTLISSILAYLAEGDRTMNIIIGSLSAFSTFLQAFSSYLKYGTRAEMHLVVAANLTDVYKGLRRKQLFAALATDGDSVKFQLEKFEERYNEAKRGCNSAIPIAIEKQYSKMEARFRFELDEVYRYETFPANCKFGYVLIWTMLCKILFSRITEYKLWPWFVGDHVDAVFAEAKVLLGGDKHSRLSDLVLMDHPRDGGATVPATASILPTGNNNNKNDTKKRSVGNINVRPT